MHPVSYQSRRRQKFHGSSYSVPAFSMSCLPAELHPERKRSSSTFAGSSLLLLPSTPDPAVYVRRLQSLLHRSAPGPAASPYCAVGGVLVQHRHAAPPHLPSWVRRILQATVLPAVHRKCRQAPCDACCSPFPANSIGLICFNIPYCFDWFDLVSVSCMYCTVKN
jgi:hypothetical protein